jgi:hypothetical protein
VRREYALPRRGGGTIGCQGEPLSDSASAQAVEIDEDIRCRGCEYNLRGLQADALCPECGGSIAESIAEHRRGVPRQLISRAAFGSTHARGAWLGDAIRRAPRVDERAGKGVAKPIDLVDPAVVGMVCRSHSSACSRRIAVAAKTATMAVRGDGYLRHDVAWLAGPCRNRR